MICAALCAMGLIDSTMALEDFTHVHTCLRFEVINILSHTLPKNSFVLQKLDEVVGGRGIASIYIEILGEFVKCFGLLNEIFD